jgi:hypothetical protein
MGTMFIFLHMGKLELEKHSQWRVPQKTGELTFVHWRSFFFQVAEERKGQYNYNISVSVLEVYNEQIRDLLASPAQQGQHAKKLDIKQVAEGVQHVPETAEVKCLGDAGFFIDEQDIIGFYHIRSYFNEVVTLQGSAKNLPLDCTSTMYSSQCSFPQYLLPYINTPIFVLNAAFDQWRKWQGD